MTDDPTDPDGAAAEPLHVLKHGSPATIRWRSGDVVRRTVVRRRRRRLALTGAATSVVAAAAALIVTLTSSSGGQSPVRAADVPGVHVGARIHGAVQLVSDDDASAPRGGPVEPVVLAQQRLAITLLQTLGTSSSNVTVSPSSLQLALAMLQNGARGTTATQIATALQSAGLSTTEQDAGLAALAAELSAAARGHIQLDSANSLWQQRGFRLRAPFLAAIAKYYGAGVWQTDFRTSQGLDALNHWTDANTHGTIPKLFDSLDPSTVLVLADALYLHADWQSPFEKGKSATGQFTTGAGGHVVAHFMSGSQATGVRTATYDAAQLPYRGGRFAAQVIMPVHGSLADFADRLSPGRLSAVSAAVRTTSTPIELPRFTTRTTVNLRPALQRLGMRQAFTSSANLSGLSPADTQLDQVMQRVYLHVNERGTTAAAATGVAIASSASIDATPIVFDHPFLFLIRDTKTGAVLFASEINDPTAA